MIALLVSIFAAGAVLFIADKIVGKKAKPEVSRKLVHIVTALLAASWPFFLSYKTIIFVELVNIVCVYIAGYLDWFSILRKVRRQTLGEFLFPVGVIVAAALHPNKWIFVAAMLHLGLADAFAALVGTTGKRKAYHVFKQRKTVEGTLVFIQTSIAITAGIIFFSSLGVQDSALWVCLLVPFGSAILENLGVYGLDNLLVPVYVTLVLKAFAGV